jgi:hypothetical protein
MIISENKGFVFLHNPKCGGTTVRECLMRFETTGNFFWEHSKINDRQVDRAHMPLYILKNQFRPYFDLLDQYFVFMFVRNPYARTVSAFNETNEAAFKALSDENNKEMALEQYRRALNEFVLNIKPARLSGYFPTFRHCVRQKDLAYIGDKCHADLIMRLEDWPKCLDSLGVFFPDLKALLLATRQMNTRALGASHAQFLSKAAIEHVNNVYDDDFALFGYEKI